MKDLTSYIKENDRDKKELDSFKKFATTLTGIEEVQGETIADVIGFINDNYSGGGSSGGPVILTVSGSSMDYLYYENGTKVKYEEAEELFKQGVVISYNGALYRPTKCCELEEWTLGSGYYMAFIVPFYSTTSKTMYEYPFYTDEKPE